MTCTTGDCTCYAAERNYWQAAYNVDSAAATNDMAQYNYWNTYYAFYHCTGSVKPETVDAQSGEIAMVFANWKLTVDALGAMLPPLIAVKDKAAEEYKAIKGEYPVGYVAFQPAVAA